ncbi:putative lipoprotein [Salinisphaera sp. T31B1]
MNSPFDAEKAQQMLKPGPNTITGSAVIRQSGGGVVTCAGNPVYLVPSTEYATQRIRAIYGNGYKGYVPAAGYRKIEFIPDEPGYNKYTRQTSCDAQGNFEFTSVADGYFYVTTAITWSVNYVAQGGALMQYVDVRGGETEKVVLSP